MFGDIYMPPIPPPGSATGDKSNATTFIKPQLEFLIIKLCNFESVGRGQLPPRGYATDWGYLLLGTPFS